MHIETVLGSIGPEELGTTLMHEHLGAIAPPGLYSGGESANITGLVESAVGSLKGYAVGSLVDLTGKGRAEGRHAFDLVAGLAPRLPVHVIAGYSFYKDPWLAEAGDPGVDELTRLYIDRATGVGDGVGKGIFGEIGTSLDAITPREETHLRAVARAHVETGLAISTHCTLGTMALEQVDILAEEGADLSRVVIGHLDLKPDPEYLEQVLATGANIAFDTFGKEWFDYRVPNSEDDSEGEYLKWAFNRPDTDRVDALSRLCALGYSKNIVLSTDMSGAESWLNLTTHGRYGYSYLPEVILPRLESLGVTAEMREAMLVGAPRRILSIP